MKLYISLTSPFARKVRIALREKELDVEEIVINPWEPSEELAQFNPLSQVPVLVSADGPIFDSCVIIEYLEDYDGEVTLVPLCGSRWPVLRWMRLADGITEACLQCFREHKRPEDKQSLELIERQAAKIGQALRWAEERVADREFVMNDRLTVADISLGCALSYLDFRFNRDWHSQHPQLTRWHTNIIQRPSFRETVPVE